MTDLSVRAVAERAQTSDRTVRRWITEGKLAATRRQDGWTVAESDLTAMLDARTASVDHTDGRGAVRPSEAPLLAEILASTQQQLLQATAAAAMWQARCEMLERALPASTQSTLGRDSEHAADESTGNTSEPAKRAWWQFWRVWPAT